jgi:uncharacterized membrane protein (UPF0127 family)
MKGSLILRRGDETLAAHVEAAHGFVGRALGWMGRREPGPGCAIHLSPCGSVHTWFMRFALDLVFLDRAGTVVRVVGNVRPWRVALGGRGAHSVIESPAAAGLAGRVRLGERLVLGTGGDP